MDRSKHLILHNGKDITKDVHFCKYNPSSRKYDITFTGNTKVYSYNYNSIEWVRNPDALSPVNVQIRRSGNLLRNIKVIAVFKANTAKYLHFRFSNGFEDTYNENELDITSSCLEEKETQSCFRYLCELASLNEISSDDGRALLKKQYEKLTFIDSNTVMATYMNPQKRRVRTYKKDSFIFPFGGNSSQFQAVANALTNQVSIIQGPPGTGKTQTILNIIVNLLIEGKTMQVVSSNNSAVLNVLEKLSSPAYQLDFLVAPLGKADNKAKFINKQTGSYPPIADWKMNANQQAEFRQKIQSHSKELIDIFQMQKRLAQTTSELDSLKVEIVHFEKYLKETNIICPNIPLLRPLAVASIMQLLITCQRLVEKKDSHVSFWFKLEGLFRFGIFNWKLYSNSLSTVMAAIQDLYYKTKSSQLSKEIAELETWLLKKDIDGKMSALTDLSMKYLRAKLYTRYGGREERKLFTDDDFKKYAASVVEEYPVVLSTTFASRSSLKDVTYDYLIMDEASQVDIATGALALSGARNAVVVGDLKQLPNVLKRVAREKSDAIFKSFTLHPGYSFSDNSFLKSVSSIISDAPQILLREHYRCHPKIIGFCNQKFYDGNLIIMTEDNEENDVLRIHEIVMGNHERDRINQRQIDVVISEVLPTLDKSNRDDVGLVAPYRKHIDAAAKQLTASIEVDTIHKFQGREKDTIVFTTVDDVVTKFSDDPNLLNVAVSRAKNHLCLVVSGNEQPANSNVGDLISYIKYNRGEIVQSKIRSVFDLLYSQYTDERIAYLKKHKSVSAYASENLMYAEIVNILKQNPDLLLNIVCHQTLNMLIRDSSLLSDDERHFVMNPATHVDFLLYSKISKKPILAIEVDGFHYHKYGTAQYERDRLKDSIMERYEIPLLRFPTNGSEECAKIESFLRDYADTQPRAASE